MTAQELREKYLKFFESKGHTIIPSASLVPRETDASTLFTTAGMHPLVPYLLGEEHPGGKRVTSVQKCVRTGDIDDVGDNRHNTFFEMLGNWSFGDYFKKEAIEWSFEFLTGKEWLGLDPQRLYVTTFKGENGIPRDETAIRVWQEVFAKAGMEVGVAGEDEIIKDNVRIIPLGTDDNFWIAGATGPCGGDTEMFYDTRPEEGKMEGKFGELVDSFRLIEIWNDVFMEFNKQIKKDKVNEANELSLKGEKIPENFYEYLKLSQQNVDTGMGMERTLAVLEGKENVFETELFQPIFTKIAELSGKNYAEQQKEFRIIADHIKAATFMISDGVVPSNVMRGYVLRRIIRRAITYSKQINIENNFTKNISETVIGMYGNFYKELEQNKNKIFEELEKEENKFRETLENGLREFNRVAHYIESIKSGIEKLRGSLIFIKENPFQINLPLIELKEDFVKKYLVYEPFAKLFEYYNQNLKPFIGALKTLDEKDYGIIKENLEINNFIFYEIDNALKNIKLKGSFVFYLYQTSGLPFEIVKEIAFEKGLQVDEKGFQEELQKHQDLSRTASAGAFKGGLQGTGEMETKFHTATHLLLAALREVLGAETFQKGSNINAERLRFDFNYPEKLTLEQLKQVEDLVNAKIQAKIPVEMTEMSKDEALKVAKVSFDPARYGEVVKVYSIGDFSVELCGGPHVANTSELGHFKITKEEASSAGVRRIKAVLE